jgi:hypothetical protein
VCEPPFNVKIVHVIHANVLSPFLPSHRLVSSSVIEAADIIEKLNLREDKNLKLALFSLQKFIKVSRIRED